MFDRLREKISSVQDARTNEEKAAEKVQRAKDSIELATAREKLRSARMDRELKEARAKIALSEAKTKLSDAKARQIGAGTTIIQARYNQLAALLGTVAGPTAKGAKVTGRGLQKVGKLLWGQPSSAPRRRRTATVVSPVAKRAPARKITAKKTTAKKTTAKRTPTKVTAKKR